MATRRVQPATSTPTRSRRGPRRVITDWLTEGRLDRMENRMATQQEMLARLNTATSRIASRLQAYIDAAVRDDAADAEDLRPLVEQLEALGADPDDVVPAPPAGGVEPDPTEPDPTVDGAAGEPQP